MLIGPDWKAAEALIARLARTGRRKGGTLPEWQNWGPEGHAVEHSLASKSKNSL
jgi:hypothetical protein